MRIELVEKAKALAGGYFWLPCPCCGRMTGGHEWKDVDGLPSSTPILDEPWMSTGICPKCTKEGYGYPFEVAVEIWGEDNMRNPLGKPYSERGDNASA